MNVIIDRLFFTLRRWRWYSFLFSLAVLFSSWRKYCKNDVTNAVAVPLFGSEVESLAYRRRCFDSFSSVDGGECCGGNEVVRGVMACFERSCLALIESLECFDVAWTGETRSSKVKVVLASIYSKIEEIAFERRIDNLQRFWPPTLNKKTFFAFISSHLWTILVDTHDPLHRYVSWLTGHGMMEKTVYTRRLFCVFWLCFTTFFLLRLLLYGCCSETLSK